jgi:hypothetical protein
LLAIAGNAAAQAVDLEGLLDKAAQSAADYRTTFKNLVAEEQRTIEYFRENGTLEDTRRVKSVFVVYESPVTKLVGEFRNVIEFNGRNVARKDEDVGKFFTKLSKANSAVQEIERLRQEGNRYDGRSSSYGLTLAQTFILVKQLRPHFTFRIVGNDKIDGRDVIVVEYDQSTATSLIKVNATNEERMLEPRGSSFDSEMPSGFRPTNPRIHGRFWLDAVTGELWRNEYHVTVHPAVLTKPVINVEFFYEYQASEFGALLPKRFWMVSYKLKGKGDADLQRTKTLRKMFEYSSFRRPDTEVKEMKVGN